MTSDRLLDPDDLAELFGSDRSRSEIESEILETAGVTSTVDEPITVNGEHVDHAQVGDVLFADYDDDISFPRDRDGTKGVPREQLIRDEISDLDGISALFRSSGDSYHVWNLTVADLEDRVLDTLRLHGDPMHAAVSLRRGMFVLRCSPKVYSVSLDQDPDPVEYKPAPVLIDVFASETDRPQSRPHFEFLRFLADRPGSETEIEHVDPDRYAWVGDLNRVGVSRYMTVTDDLKREVW